MALRVPVFTTHACFLAIERSKGRVQLFAGRMQVLGGRGRALAPALDFYNRFRPHRALSGLTPLRRVNNLPGTYS
jgi:hypothetical protein